MQAVYVTIGIQSLPLLIYPAVIKENAGVNPISGDAGWIVAPTVVIPGIAKAFTVAFVITLVGIISSSSSAGVAAAAILG